MFNNQAGAKENKLNVNTRGIQLYNTEGFDPSTLVLDFWNDSMFSIKLHPAKEKAKQTEREKFDYEQSVNTALSMNKAVELLANTDKVWEAHTKNEEVSFYVNISGVNLLGIGTKNIDDRNVIFFAIHKQLNDNRIPAMSMYYEFLPGEIITNFDPATGNFGKENSGRGEYELFVRYLSNGIDAMSKAVCHSIRVVDNFYRKRIEDKIDSIMAATGAQNNYANNGGNRGGSGRSLFNGSDSSSSAPRHTAEEETISGDNIDEELPF